MEESIATWRDWLLQMAPAMLVSSVRSVLSDPILSIVAKVEVFAQQDTIAPEKQPHHLNVLLAHSTTRHIQLSLQTVYHALQDITVKAMATRTQMDLVMRDGSAAEVLMPEDLFQM